MLSAKIKFLLAGISATAVLGASFAVHQWGYARGVAKERDTQAQAVLRWQQKATEAVQALEKAEQARREVVKETIEVIRYVEDPTGCADADIPDGIIKRLH